MTSPSLLRLRHLSALALSLMMISLLPQQAWANAPFSLSLGQSGEQSAYELLEGDAAGVSIPITLVRASGFTAPVTLSVYASNPDDERGMVTSFSPALLGAEESASELSMQLSIDVLPILPQQRDFTITASDGSYTAQASVSIAVTPTTRDDVYLLIGQSNAVGASGNRTKQAGPGQPDETNPRILQANVRGNNYGQYRRAAHYVNPAWNFGTPQFVVAEDPLHQPRNPRRAGKGAGSIGMGISFAKTALPATSRNIVLVPAAWGGSGFCNNNARKKAHWNALPINNRSLGNTLLFQRALSRVNHTLNSTGGVLRGILWHQGESDSVGKCAQFYEGNMRRLITQLRTQIVVDARGEEARGANANVPFILGTMSRGSDRRGNFTNFSAPKQVVDGVHRNIANLVPHSEVVINADLTPANGYRCGSGSCIHFGPEAMREMGSRYYEALLRAVMQ